MFKISFEVLVHVKNFKLMTARQASFLQLRLNVQNHSINKKNCQQVVPYLILTPDKHPSQIHSVSNQRGQRKNSNSFDKQYSFQAENNSKNIFQIDSENNSFLTKPFIVRQIDIFQTIDQIIVFKGSFQVNSNQIIESGDLQKQNKRLLNKIYLNCELLLISSYSTESIGQWCGYSLADEGNFALPMGFFSYNSSCAEAQMCFLWTSVELLDPQNLKNLGDSKLNKINQLFQSKISKISQSILQIPKEFSNNLKKIIHVKNSGLKSFECLKQTLHHFNQQIYPQWKKYQQYQQKCVQNNLQYSKQNVQKRFSEKIQSYQRALTEYHWKNNIIVTQEIQPQKIKKQQSQIQNLNQDQLKQTLHLQQKNNRKMPSQLAKLKKNASINKNLPFYPFCEHQRLIKLGNQDFKKIAAISSLSSKFQLKSHNKVQDKAHLIIFVHGYQASGYDMQNLANFLKFKSPKKIKVYLSTCNQGRTEQQIQQSGHRLAIQIKNYINNKFQFQDFDISFVCHSMGGLIARAALKYLQLYKNKFKTFLSLCSPHLGYLYHSSTLIKTSIWVLNQVKKDPSMIQLTMHDNSQLQKTFLFELSKRTELSWFKYPIFIGSREDEYVPFWSALVRDKDFFFQTKQAKIYRMLYKNLGQKIQSKIIRLEAIYKDKINDISSFVGRTPHIRILNCIQMMEMIYLLIQKAF